MEITPTIADSRYYGIANMSHGPKVTFLLFYFHYNGHLGHTHVLNDIFWCLCMYFTLKIVSFHKL